MGTFNGIVGRQREMALLQEIYESPRAEFVAVYGRRRIGKTYLIDKFFGDKYDFYMTGIYEGTRKEQPCEAGRDSAQRGFVSVWVKKE